MTGYGDGTVFLSAGNNVGELEVNVGEIDFKMVMPYFCASAE